MKKKLLLVDDEVTLLNSLTDFLTDSTDMFEISTSTSVKEAIRNTQKTNFDLIVTDIRMPGKSGIDLLIHLKKKNFKGKVMAMTAYGNEKIFAQVHQLGGMRVILKPFDFASFKNLLVQVTDDHRGFSGTIQYIDLTSLLQLINLEKKSVTVKIKIDNHTGYIFFEEGEIIEARYNGIDGRDAFTQILEQNRGEFSVIRRRKVSRAIRKPFLHLLMNTMKIIDEKREEKVAAPLGTRSAGSPIDHVEIDEKIFSAVTDISGFKEAAIYNHEGELLMEERSGSFSMKERGEHFLQLYNDAVMVCGDMKCGTLNHIQFHSEKFIIIVSELIAKKIYIVVALESWGNLGMVKNKLKSITDRTDQLISFG